MIIRPAEIYRRAAEANNIPLDTITSVGEAMFGELLGLMNNPKDLAYELDHIGTFILRHKSFLRRLGSAKHFEDAEFVHKYEHVEVMIEDFKVKKAAHKKYKDEYKALKQSKG